MSFHMGGIPPNGTSFLMMMVTPGISVHIGHSKHEDSEVFQLHAMSKKNHAKNICKEAPKAGINF